MPGRAATIVRSPSCRPAVYLSYLTELLNAAPAVANVAAYGRTIHEKFRVRQLIATCQRVSAQGYLDYGEAQQYIDGAEQDIYEIARTPESSSVEKLLDVMKKSFKALTEAMQRGDRITGTPSGFDRYDRLTAGLHPGDLSIVAARPGMGKTSFVLNVATNVASPRGRENPNAKGEEGRWDEPGVGVAVFSLEMPREQLANRMLCSEARVDVSKMRTGHLSQHDWSSLTQAASFLSNLPIWIDDSPHQPSLGHRFSCPTSGISRWTSRFGSTTAAECARFGSTNNAAIISRIRNSTRRMVATIFPPTVSSVCKSR